MTGRKRAPVILAFGGFDPTAGAGVLADARAIEASGGYAVAVPSCLALQSTAAFGKIVPLSRSTLDRALGNIVAAHAIAAVKVGMVGTRIAAEALMAFLDERTDLPVVLDPVIRSTSGGALLAKNALPAYRRLLARADVLTPNLTEAEKILARAIDSFESAVVASRDISNATGAIVVIKGGHFPWRGYRGHDLVFEDGALTVLAPGRKLPRRDAHGTGCAFASSLATRLAAGDPPSEAARFAKSLVECWIAEGFPSAEGRWTLFGSTSLGKSIRNPSPDPRTG